MARLALSTRYPSKRSHQAGLRLKPRLVGTVTRPPSLSPQSRGRRAEGVAAAPDGELSGIGGESSEVLGVGPRQELGLNERESGKVGGREGRPAWEREGCQERGGEHCTVV